MPKDDDNKPTLTPRLRFPEFREAWEPITVGDFFDRTDKAEKTTTFDKDKVLTVKLHANGVVKNEKTTLTGGANYFTRTAGQFIFSKIDLLNGAFGIVPDALDGFSSSSDVPAYSFNTEQSATFFLNWLKASYQRLEIERTGTSSTLKRVSPEKFLSLAVFAPSPAEQQKIANCLMALDEVVAAQGRKVEALRAHKRGLMQQLFPREGEPLPRLRFPEFCQEPKWRLRSISEVVSKVSRAVDVHADTVYREIGVRSHGKGIFHKEPATGKLIGDKRVFWVEPTALVVNIIFAWEQAVATTSEVEEGMIASHRFPMYVAKEGQCDVQFLMHAFLTPEGKCRLGLASPGGAGRNRTLGQAEFDKLEMMLPIDLREQTAIARCLDTADAQIAAESEKLDTLKTHTKGLMQQLFPSPEGVNDR